MFSMSHSVLARDSSGPGCIRNESWGGGAAAKGARYEAITGPSEGVARGHCEDNQETSTRFRRISSYEDASEALVGWLAQQHLSWRNSPNVSVNHEVRLAIRSIP